VQKILVFLRLQLVNAEKLVSPMNYKIKNGFYKITKIFVFMDV